MPEIEIAGVYPVDAPQPCHLIELNIRNCQDEVDVGQITQHGPSQPQGSWQVPYMGRLLDSHGTAIIADDFEMRRNFELWSGNVRLCFFFHYLDLARPLSTPFGDVQLPQEAPLPQRLTIVEYEPVD